MFSRNRSTISCSGVSATIVGASRRVTQRFTSSSTKNVTKNAAASPAWAESRVQNTVESPTSRYQSTST